VRTLHQQLGEECGAHTTSHALHAAWIHAILILEHKKEKSLETSCFKVTYLEVITSVALPSFCEILVMDCTI
jgi:hypothetical protein